MCCASCASDQGGRGGQAELFHGWTELQLSLFFIDSLVMFHHHHRCHHYYSFPLLVVSSSFYCYASTGGPIGRLIAITCSLEGEGKKKKTLLRSRCIDFSHRKPCLSFFFSSSSSFFLSFFLSLSRPRCSRKLSDFFGRHDLGVVIVDVKVIIIIIIIIIIVVVGVDISHS